MNEQRNNIMALDESRAYYERGILLYDLGQYTDSVRSFNKARESLGQDDTAHIKMQNALILIAKAGALDSLGQRSPPSYSKLKYREALRYLERSINILITLGNKHCLAIAYHNKGYTQGNLKQYEDSLVALNESIKYYQELYERNEEKFGTEYAEALCNRGFIIAMLSRTKQGRDMNIADFDKALKIDPSLSLTYNTKGYVYEIFGKFDEAEEWFYRAIKRDPYLASAWYNRGYVIFEEESNKDHMTEDEKREKYQKAIECIDNAIIIDSKISYEWYYKGYILYRGLKKYPEAIRCFDNALELDPNFAYAWYNKGLVLVELGSYSDAVECLDGAIKCLDKDDLEKIAFVLFNKATALALLGEKNEHYFRKALNCFEDAIEKLERTRDAYNLETRDEVTMLLALSYHGKGWTYGNLTQYKEALKWFSKAELSYKEYIDRHDVGKIKTEFADTLRNIGFVYDKLGDPIKANSYLAKSLAIAPEFGYAWNSMGFHILEHHSQDNGSLSEAVENFDKAIECFKKEDDVDSNIFYPYYYKGRALYQLRKYTEAIECFDIALGSRSDNVDAWFGKGLSCYSIGKQDKEMDRSIAALRAFLEAVKCFEEAIRVNPSHEGWYYKAITTHYLKRYDEAVKCFDEATKLNPRDIDTWYYKGLTLYSMKRYEEAIDCFDMIYNDFKEHLNNDRELVASSLCYKGSANFWLVKKNGPDNIMEETERYQETIDCYDEALDLYRNSRGSKYGLDRGDILFDRGMFKFYSKDFSQSRLDFEASLREETATDDKKSRIYNNIGICYFNAGEKFYGNAEGAFFKAIDINSKQGISYYNLATLYSKENKHDKGRKILERYNGNHSLVDEAKKKLKEAQAEVDWYNCWFSQPKLKKTMGIMLIAAILTPFIGVALVMIIESSHEYVTVQAIFRDKAEIIIGGFITLVGIIVGVLLLPSLHKVKVGNALELEKDSPRFAESSETSFRPKFRFIPNLSLPKLREFRLPAEKPDGRNAMPLKYQRQSLFMPTALNTMPTRVSLPSGISFDR